MVLKFRNTFSIYGPGGSGNLFGITKEELFTLCKEIIEHLDKNQLQMIDSKVWVTATDKEDK